MGMVGGGSDAFIGAVHRCAALMENEIELVCGCFSVNPEISISSGRSYYVPDNRIYTTWEEMLEKEAALPEDERMDFVTIVTPNRFHYGPAMRALELGFNVVIDKPMTLSLEEALSLRDKVNETGPDACIQRLSCRQGGQEAHRARRSGPCAPCLCGVLAGVADAAYRA